MRKEKKEMYDVTKEINKAILISNIKNFINNVEMWQNFIIRWTPYAKDSENILKTVEHARAMLSLNLAKIKLFIGRFEQC